jgi:hypothetical protein
MAVFLHQVQRTRCCLTFSAQGCFDFQRDPTLLQKFNRANFSEQSTSVTNAAPITTIPANVGILISGYGCAFVSAPISCFVQGTNPFGGTLFLAKFCSKKLGVEEWETPGKAIHLTFMVVRISTYACLHHCNSR